MSEMTELDAIKHRGAAMKRVVSQARRVAQRNVPVLIQGEAGTEKELFARAIHAANPFRKGPFIAVKCAAIPDEWVESELFGATIGQHRRTTDPAGYVEAADGGTLFLDDVDELPLEAQVKLFRVLQEGQVTSIGFTTPRAVNVRLIAATARDLRDKVAKRHFSEDLFYSIAVAILTLPALRERGEDLGLLVDAVLAKVNREAQANPAGEHKRLSAGARKLLVRHNWPGNVRELENTLRRMAVWSLDAVIDVGDVEEAIFSPRMSEGETILGRPLGKGLSLPGILSEVARHYLERAMQESQGTKTRAAELVGLPNHQTLTNWLLKYGVEAKR